ncbi:MAG: diguanylate cyclase, partial [Oscillospiraceae bacterium]
MKKMPIWAKLLGVVAVLAILTGIVWDFSIQLQGILRNKTYETMAETSVDYNSSFFELLKDEEIETTELTIQMILKIFVIVFLVLAFIIFSKYRHSKEIAAANQECQALLSNINGGMMITKLSKNLLALKPYYFSKLCEEITGYTLSEIEKFHDGLNEIVYPEDKENVQKTYLQQISKGDTYRLTYRVVQKNGEIVWIMDNGYMLKNEDGEELNYSIITDITSLKQQEEALRVSSERFRIAIEASKGTIFEVDVKSQIYTHFENAERIFGISNEKILEDTRKFSELSPEEYKKATSAYFSHPDDAEAIGKAFSEVLKGKPIGYEARMRRFDGSYIWCKIDLGIILDSEGEPMRLVGYIVDISETKKENEMLKKQVKIDPLTGLYNKTATMILANSILEKEPEGRHSLIVLDIDNFKGVNDTLGHSFGDAVLVDVSAKLKAVFRSDDVVGRIGGDEFAILMKNVPDTNRVLKKAAEISGIFRQTYAGEKENYKISCSMGIVMVENKDERFKTLFLKADAALYQAKQNGKDMFVLYDSDKINNYMTLNAKPNDDVEFMKTHNSLQEQIFTLLYDAKDFESSINMALVTIGQKYNVSRTYVFENDEKNEYTSNTYEW